MKVKTLLILIIVLLIGVAFILPEAFLYGVEKIEEDDRAVSLYGYYLNMPFARSRDKALYKKAKALVSYIGTYDIFMGLRGSSGGLLTEEEMEKAIEAYEEILNKYEDSPYYVEAYKNLLDLYIGMGDVEKLEDLIDWGRDSSNEEIVYTSYLYTAFNHMVNREYHEALEIVGRYIGEGLEDGRLYALKGSIHFLQEEYEKAERVFENIEAMDYVHNRDGNLFGSLRNVYDGH